MQNNVAWYKLYTSLCVRVTHLTIIDIPAKK